MYVKEELKAEIISEAFAKKVVQQLGLLIRVACQAFQLHQACYSYEARCSIEDDETARWLLRLTDNNRNWASSCAFYICATCVALFGTTSVCIAFTAS